MSSDLIIREFELRDRDSVIELYNQGKEAYSHIPVYYTVISKRFHDRMHPGGDIYDIKSKYMAQTSGPKSSCMWVAELAGKIVGMIGAVPSTKFNQNEYVELVRMSVSTECRKMGVGSRLIGVLENWAVKQGYQFVNLYTLGAMFLAVALYEKNGYTLVETEKKDITKEFHFAETTVIDVVHFVKKLT